LQDGDFIIFHNSYDNAEAFGAKEVVTFDVWRMEDGQVAEHWDNITPKAEQTASGRSQVDGPTQITDLDKTASNKTIVSNFVNDVLFGKAPEKITDYISTEQYDQHNPMVKDGLAGLTEAIAYLTSQNDMFIYKKTHKVLGEGNFVLAMSEGEWHGKPHAFYDLFRLENDKIVEHWDVIEEIPSEMAHNNGKF
jgi:predicted SnoaL-like aldol condensation-catalyzing enzyme